MKKVYIEPMTKVVPVKIENLLTVLSANGTTNEGTADTRGGGFWDDED